MTRIPAHEVLEAAAWVGGAIAIALLFIAWPFAAWMERLLATRYANESSRLEEQLRRERQAAKGAAA